VRGSPIRKSSDQRSVDSSPRLIAASYVLHRLLVPRHPPCALKNLATQKSHHPTPGRKRCGGPTRTLYYRVRRCSRPLCSSQRTTGHPPPDPADPDPPRRTAGGTRCRKAPHEATVARSLRTQQRAYDRHPTHRLRSTRTPRGPPYWEPAPRAGRTGQCSTLEHHPGRSAAIQTG
jgi:hypothetical protein